MSQFKVEISRVFHKSKPIASCQTRETGINQRKFTSKSGQVTRETWISLRLQCSEGKLPVVCLSYANPDLDLVDKLNEIASYIWWHVIKFRSRPGRQREMK